MTREMLASVERSRYLKFVFMEGYSPEYSLDRQTVCTCTVITLLSCLYRFSTCCSDVQSLNTNNGDLGSTRMH